MRAQKNPTGLALGNAAKSGGVALSRVRPPRGGVCPQIDGGAPTNLFSRIYSGGRMAPVHSQLRQDSPPAPASQSSNRRDPQIIEQSRRPRGGDVRLTEQHAQLPVDLASGQFAEAALGIAVPVPLHRRHDQRGARIAISASAGNAACVTATFQTLPDRRLDTVDQLIDALLQAFMLAYQRSVSTRVSGVLFGEGHQHAHDRLHLPQTMRTIL